MNSAKGVCTMRLALDAFTSTADFATATAALEWLSCSRPQPAKRGHNASRSIPAAGAAREQRLKQFPAGCSARSVSSLRISAYFSILPANRWDYGKSREFLTVECTEVRKTKKECEAHRKLPPAYRAGSASSVSTSNGRSTNEWGSPATSDIGCSSLSAFHGECPMNLA